MGYSNSMPASRNLRQTLIYVRRFVQRRSPVVTAFLFGAGCAFVREIMNAFGPEPLAPIWMCSVFPLGLVGMGYPFVSWKRAVIIPVCGTLGLTLSSPLLWRLFRGYWTPVPWTWLPLGLLTVALPLAALSLIIVVVRRRYWPVYPAGHCQVCGYCLYGLTGDRCPECGSLFRTADGLPDVGKDTPSERSVQ
jgi:hypothetical protein